MPQPTASPRVDPRTGRTTAASPGPSSRSPTSGLITVRACTSWSYWRMIHSLLQTSQCCKSASRSARKVRAGGPAQGTIRRGRPACLANDRRAAFVQEPHRQVGDDLPLVTQREPA